MVGRFAPTPSGRMHIGNIYAMTAAWLSARVHHEPIYLRIEDIDQPRVVPDADRWIMDDLNWLGLNWDGEPIYQSQRLDLYDDYFARLQHEQHSPLYPCFCSRAEIRAASAPQEGDRFIIYPGTCRTRATEHPDDVAARLANGDRHSWRLAVPLAYSHGAHITVHDRVYGTQSFDIGAELGDVIMRRSDGLYSYQFVVTLDDALMGVDDIVRGRDLLRSTALQQYLRSQLALVADPTPSDIAYSANSVPSNMNEHSQTTTIESSANPFVRTPQYAHLPLLDNAAGVRLAKRTRSLDLGALREQGVQPNQIIGYCAWALGLIEEPAALSTQDALRRFSWSKVQSARTDIRVPNDLAQLLLRL